MREIKSNGRVLAVFFVDQNLCLITFEDNYTTEPNYQQESLGSHNSLKKHFQAINKLEQSYDNTSRLDKSLYYLLSSLKKGHGHPFVQFDSSFPKDAFVSSLVKIG